MDRPSNRRRFLDPGPWALNPVSMFRYALPLALLAFTTTVSAQDVHVKVDPNGGGSIASTDNFATIQQALDHAPQAPNGHIFIHIAPGVYHERINVTRLRPRLTLLGEGKRPEDVVITAA